MVTCQTYQRNWCRAAEPKRSTKEAVRLATKGANEASKANEASETNKTKKANKAKAAK
ncbi:hypothetical protein VB005_11931 [Metarhizium brunneum]